MSLHCTCSNCLYTEACAGGQRGSSCLKYKSVMYLNYKHSRFVAKAVHYAQAACIAEQAFSTLIASMSSLPCMSAGGLIVIQHCYEQPAAICACVLPLHVRSPSRCSFAFSSECFEQICHFYGSHGSLSALVTCLASCSVQSLNKTSGFAAKQSGVAMHSTFEHNPADQLDGRCALLVDVWDTG